MAIADLDPIIRIKLILFLVTYLLLTYLFSYFMRSYLNIEKRSGFFRKYVNNKHKKTEQFMTGIFVAILFGTYFYDTRVLNGIERSFKTLYVLLSYILVMEVIRIFMEWKYSSDHKKYILTLSELIFTIVIIGIAFTSNIFILFR